MSRFGVFAYLKTDSRSHEVTPSFAHTTGLKRAEAITVGWATRETVGNTVTVSWSAKNSKKASQQSLTYVYS
jgi:hypothetical protein